ncbi:MAG: asparagine synthase [Peptococcaceae bacterium]|nr:asparagine synthase [Peptococcaceae bacterium]
MAREGMIPTLLGSAVTAAGVAMRVRDMKRNSMSKQSAIPMIGAGVIGFGLAHMVLGGIDLLQPLAHRY